MAMTSDRVLALAVAALCVAAASMVWSIVMIVRVAVDGYGFRKRSSISSTNSVLVQWLRIGNWIAPSQVGISDLLGIGYQSLVISVRSA